MARTLWPGKVIETHEQAGEFRSRGDLPAPLPVAENRLSEIPGLCPRELLCVLFPLDRQRSEARVGFGCERPHLSGLGELVEKLGTMWAPHTHEIERSANQNDEQQHNDEVPLQIAPASRIVCGWTHLNTTVLTCKCFEVNSDWLTHPLDESENASMKSGVVEFLLNPASAFSS
jgi:hypothetical protein